jgi:allantoin racemase
MKLMVINPNTSESMTDHIRKELNWIKRADTELTVVRAEKGPETIESAYDEAHAIPPTLELVKRANQEGYDAVILACFSDPGLEAAKEVSEIPVIGIEESTLHMAAMLGARFTVVTPRRNRVPTKRVHVHARGLDYYLASVRCLDLSTAEADSNPKETKKRILKVAREAVEEDGAEVIILGCAGMAGYGADIERKLKIKVLDPAAIGLKVAEAMADLKLVHSKRGLFATPPKKIFRR